MSPGYPLPAGTDLAKLEAAITAAMTQGQLYSLEFSGPDKAGDLVLNGAELPFAIICPAASGA